MLNLSAENKPRRLISDHIACAYYSDIEAVGKMVQQGDNDAIARMINSNRCFWFKKGPIIYIMDTVGIHDKIRIKGSTISVWTILAKKNSEPLEEKTKRQRQH